MAKKSTQSLERSEAKKQEISAPSKQKEEGEVSLSNKKEDKYVTLNEIPRNKISETLDIKNSLGFETDKSIEKRRRLFKNICTIVFIIFVVAVLIYTAVDDLSSGETTLTWKQISNYVKWPYLLCALASVAVFLLSKGLQRSILCKSTTGRFHLKTSIEAGIVCQFYNNVTPLAVGGQPFEVHYFSKHGVHGGHASSIPISVYIINMFTAVILSLLAIIFFQSNTVGFVPNQNGLSIYNYMPTTLRVLAIIGLCLNLITPAVVLIFCIFRKLGAKLVSLVIWLGGKLKIVKNPKLLYYKTLRSVLVNSKTIKALFKKPLTLFMTTIMSVTEQVAFSSISFFILKFYGFEWNVNFIQEWLQIVTLSIIISSAVTMIPTPGNSGAIDLSFYYVFKNELAVGLAFPAMITWRATCFYLVVAIGFIFLRIKSLIERKKTSQENRFSDIQ